MKTCQVQLVRASKLTVGLADEEVRWQRDSTSLGEQIQCLVGDAFLSAACVSYYGAFTGSYRAALVAQVCIHQQQHQHSIARGRDFLWGWKHVRLIFVFQRRFYIFSLLPTTLFHSKILTAKILFECFSPPIMSRPSHSHSPHTASGWRAARPRASRSRPTTRSCKRSATRC